MSSTDTKNGDPLMLECWNCGHEFESQTLGYVIDSDLAAEACPRCGYHFQTPPLRPRDFDELARSPEDHPRWTLSDEEVSRRLPALDLIVDDDVREETARLSASAPAYFWRAPAANPQSDYHHPLCREDHGLWAHTLMLLAPLSRYEESLRAQDRLTLEQRDYAISAAILHDQRKRGPHGTTGGSSTSDHAVVMADVIREESALPNAVAGAVECHMGPEEWGYDGAEPANDLADLVHMADMLASTANADLHVPGPVPEELRDLGLQEGDY